MFEWTPRLIQYRRQFLRKYNYEFSNFPLFKWQKYFDGGQPISTEEELLIKIEYLRKQWIKHEFPTNKFLYISENIPTDLVFVGKNQLSNNKLQ